MPTATHPADATTAVSPNSAPRDRFGRHPGRWPFPVATRHDREAKAQIEQAAPSMLVLAYRVARLNPDAGEIGAGMLKSLVEDARSVVLQAGGSTAW